MRIPVLSVLLVITAALLFSPAARATDPPRPNVVILLCDDLGYGDLGCFGHPAIRTPNLDRLAADGMRLTDCYSAMPVCSPSRAGLLTGRVPNRAGIHDWIPQGTGIYLQPNEVTIAHLLREAGYRTCHAGKWHLNSKFNGSEPTPGEAGFEHWLCTQNNAAPNHLDPTNFIRNRQRAGRLKGPSSHVVVEEAVRWLDGVKEGEPFFLNVWFHEPHEPVAAEDGFLALYPDEADADRRQYYACVSQMDAAVGKLMKYLDARGLRENTFVFFSSDNGPETLDRYPNARRSHGSAGPLRGMKLHMTEGGIRVPGIVRWPARVKAGSVSAEPVGSVDLLPTLCAMAGVDPPADRALDGGSILPLFNGKTISRPHPLYWQYDLAIGEPWTIAMRDGAWKLLANTTTDQFALYNLADDTGERHDLAHVQPERVRAMAETMKKLHAKVAADAAKSGNPLPKAGRAAK